MLLTTQILNDAPVVLNPEQRVTLVLRGLHLTEIPNTLVPQDKFQVLDLNNNELIGLDNITMGQTQLEVVLLANNNISYIDEDVTGLGNIKSLSLMNNNLYCFQPCFSKVFSKIVNLVLTGNPIVQIPEYRLFMIWLVPSLKVLDFKRVKSKEILDAEQRFGVDRLVYNEHATAMFGAKPPSFNLRLNNHQQPVLSSDKQMSVLAKKLPDEVKAELLKKLEAATTIEEIEMLEEALKLGDI